jgi:hypothetical protein
MRQEWKARKQEETYASAESQPFRRAEDRRAELAAIEEFVKKRGVRKIPTPPPPPEE